MKTNRYGIRRGRDTPAEVCRDLVAKFDRSGGTQASFCREHGLNVKTFARWVKRERRDARVAPTLFTEVQISPVAVSQVEVALRNGIIMRVNDVGDIAVLASRLESIGGAGC